jgi:hypothetical protein
MSQIKAQEFLNAFINVFQRSRTLYANIDDWQTTWETRWNDFMMYEPTLPQTESVMKGVAAELGVHWWRGEPFRLDGALVDKEPKTIGCYPFPLLVAFEHEHNCVSISEEITKLLQIRAPLKVAITYVFGWHNGSENQLPQQRDEAWAKNEIVRVHRVLNTMLKNYVMEDDRIEYLYLLGVESELRHLKWEALMFGASEDPQIENWTTVIEQ